MWRMPSTAAWSAASLSPAPTSGAVASAAASVTRTSSSARLRSGSSRRAGSLMAGADYTPAHARSGAAADATLVGARVTTILACTRTPRRRRREGPPRDSASGDHGRSSNPPGRSARAREPADRGARAAARRAHLARHLRRHRRSRAAQTAARALQPRARRRAARALPPRRRLAQRARRRRLPRRLRGGDPPLLAPHARPGRAEGSARERPVRRRARSTTDSVYKQLGRGARGLRARGRRTAQPRLLPLDRARASSR